MSISEEICDSVSGLTDKIGLRLNNREWIVTVYPQQVFAGERGLSVQVWAGQRKTSEWLITTGGEHVPIGLYMMKKNSYHFIVEVFVVIDVTFAITGVRRRIQLLLMLLMK